MEKLQKNLFADSTLESKTRTYAGICGTFVGGTVTKCCNGAGLCWFDSGQ